MYRINKQARLKSLLEIDKNIFTAAELAVLWGIESDNTLWTILKRYASSKVIHRIRKGLYSKVDVKKLDSYEIGSALMGPFSYVSLETILAKAGIIMQSVNKITMLGLATKNAKFMNTDYSCKKLLPEYLINREGITYERGYNVASIERAVADIQHFKPNYYFDNPQAINWPKVEEIQKKVGYK